MVDTGQKQNRGAARAKARPSCPRWGSAGGRGRLRRMVVAMIIVAFTTGPAVAVGANGEAWAVGELGDTILLSDLWFKVRK